ncbi:hypothetical protein D3C86_420290 [compost metagenome]
MRFPALPQLACLTLLAVAIAGCAVPARPDPADLGGKTLLVRPLLIEGAWRTQGIVNPKTAADIAVLEVVPYMHVGNDVFWPIAPLTGEATDSTDPGSILKARLEGFDPQRETVIPLTGLRPQTRYRVVARAYDASSALISTEDARSWAEVAVLEDNRPTVPVALPVTLIDTPFGATRSFSLTITGRAFNTITGTLYKVRDEGDEAVPGGTLNLTPENATRRVTLSNLEAQTSYRLVFRALDEAALPIGLKTLDWTITNDDAPVHADVNWEIPLP